MADITIVTNGRERHTLDWSDLTDAERKQFDYLQTEEQQHGTVFFRYRGWTYEIGEFMRVGKDSPFADGWHGYASDSYFSGVVVRFPRQSTDSIIVGRYY